MWHDRHAASVIRLCGSGARASGTSPAVALRADTIARRDERSAMRAVAVRARHACRVHLALQDDPYSYTSSSCWPSASYSPSSSSATRCVSASGRPCTRNQARSDCGANGSVRRSRPRIATAASRQGARWVVTGKAPGHARTSVERKRPALVGSGERWRPASAVPTPHAVSQARDRPRTTHSLPTTLVSNVSRSAA